MVISPSVSVVFQVQLYVCIDICHSTLFLHSTLLVAGRDKDADNNHDEDEEESQSEQDCQMEQPTAAQQQQQQWTSLQKYAKRAVKKSKPVARADKLDDDDEEESQYELSQSLLSQPVGDTSQESQDSLKDSQASEDEEPSQPSEDEEPSQASEEEEAQASRYVDDDVEESQEIIPPEQEGPLLSHVGFLIKKFNEGDLSILKGSISMCQFLAMALMMDPSNISRTYIEFPGYNGGKRYPGSSKTINSGWMNANGGGITAAGLFQEYQMYIDRRYSQPQAPSRRRWKLASRGKVIESKY